MAALATNQANEDAKFQRAKGRSYAGLEHDGGKGKRGRYFFVQMADTQFGMMKGQHSLQCEFEERGLRFPPSSQPAAHATRTTRHTQGCAISEVSSTMEP